jgi:Putative transposase
MVGSRTPISFATARTPATRFVAISAQAADSDEAPVPPTTSPVSTEKMPT